MVLARDVFIAACCCALLWIKVDDAVMTDMNDSLTDLSFYELKRPGSEFTRSRGDDAASIFDQSYLRNFIDRKGLFNHFSTSVYIF